MSFSSCDSMDIDSLGLDDQQVNLSSSCDEQNGVMNREKNHNSEDVFGKDDTESDIPSSVVIERRISIEG